MGPLSKMLQLYQLHFDFEFESGEQEQCIIEIDDNVKLKYIRQGKVVRKIASKATLSSWEGTNMITLKIGKIPSKTKIQMKAYCHLNINEQPLSCI